MTKKASASLRFFAWTAVALTFNMALVGCSSTTVIRSDPSNARVYVDGAYVGTTPYTYSSQKIVGASTSVVIHKEGYKKLSAVISRSESFSVGACIGGVFLLVPFLWIMDYDPEHNYALQKGPAELTAAAPSRTTPVQSPRVATPRARSPRVATPTGAARPKNYAVLAFDIEDPNDVFSPKLLRQLTDYLVAQMSEQAGYRFVPSQKLREKMTKDKKKSYRMRFDQRHQIELGKALSAKKILVTKILQLGARCAVSSTIYDIKTEATEHAATVEGSCSASWLQRAIKGVALKLR